MLYRIEKAIPHSNYAIEMTWSDGVTGQVDLGLVVAKGKVFTALQDPTYFVGQMRIANNRLGLEWPSGVDFSADGLRFMAFPEEAAEEFVPSTTMRRTG
jgi:hypothetical protein